MRSTHTTTDGCRLVYETHGFDGSGDKPAVAFLNGTTQSALMWRPQALFLKKDFRVVCYDGRAQGKSDPGKRTLSLDLHVEDLFSLLSFLQIDKAHLVGQSHGAQVALAFAGRHPHRAARLVLCGIGAQTGSRTRSLIRSWIEILNRGGLTAMAWAMLPVILGENYLRSNQRILPKMVEAVAARNRKACLLTHLEALLSYPPPSVHAAGVCQPCLVLSGSDDLLSPLASAQRLSQIIAAEYKVFERIGHSLPVEAAARFSRRCLQFLSEPPAS